MKVYRKILDIFVKIVAVMEMLLVSGIVCMMLAELCARNFLNISFRFSTELCGFMFMWMAFMGIVVLYDREGLITLDIVYLHVPAKIQKLFWFVSKIISIGLGVTMILAYINMYPINSTSYFSTMQFISKAWHFLPMAIAGGFMVVASVYQILARIMGIDAVPKNQEG